MSLISNWHKYYKEYLSLISNWHDFCLDFIYLPIKLKLPYFLHMKSEGLKKVIRRFKIKGYNTTSFLPVKIKNTTSFLLDLLAKFTCINLKKLLYILILINLYIYNIILYWQ